MTSYTYSFYEFDTKSGKFIFIRTILNTSESLDRLILSDKLSNKFLLIEKGDSEGNHFYTVRTDNDGVIIEFNTIGPNNYNKEMLIDAIVGIKPTMTFMENSDKSINKLIEVSYTEDSKFKWVIDIKDYLEKMNVIRLMEIYKNLKELT